MPYRDRHSAGTAYVDAASGIREWNAVSRHATAGMRGSSSLAAETPASADGRCSGARSVMLTR